MMDTTRVPPLFGVPLPDDRCEAAVAAEFVAAVPVGALEVLPHASSRVAPPSATAPWEPLLKRCRRVIGSMSWVPSLARLLLFPGAL
jgi:hypothetical protein